VPTANLTASARPMARWSRWVLIAAALLVGAALVATVWTTRRGVGGASEALERGQADLLRESVRARALEIEWPPEPEDLAMIAEDLAPEGLRYLAVLGPGGEIVADAGTPSVAREALARELAGARPNVPVRVGGVLRLVDRRTDRRSDRRPVRRRAHLPRRASPILIEFEPRVADQLRSSADRALALGALTAGGLLVVAVVLFRWILHRERLERRLVEERRLASLGQMSAVLAHEIRNPLASLKGNAQMLARGLPEGDRSRARADRVVAEAVRLEELTTDLLEFARSGAIRQEVVDPAALLREAAAGMPVDIDAAAAPAAWSFDRERIRQVLVNLLENAVWASGEGGRVAARVAQEAGQLVYTVRDRGPGIPEESLPRIFEPFFTGRTDGTGLGLAVARRIVELHGGSIAARNHPDGGAEMRVALPRGA
jgi:two-component system sensor histidine kinase HydH